MASIQNATPREQEAASQPQSNARVEGASERAEKVAPSGSHRLPGSAINSGQQPAASSTRSPEQTTTSAPRVSQQTATFSPSSSMNQQPVASALNDSLKPARSPFVFGASQKPGTPAPRVPPAPYTPSFGNDINIFEKHALHWYPLGDVLLQIGRVRFKAHRGHLDTYSTWFQRALHRIHCRNPSCAYLQGPGSLPTVSVKVSNVEGLPLLYIDTAETPGAPSATDFSVLLDVLYQGL